MLFFSSQCCTRENATIFNRKRTLKCSTAALYCSSLRRMCPTPTQRMNHRTKQRSGIWACTHVSIPKKSESASGGMNTHPPQMTKNATNYLREFYRLFSVQCPPVLSQLHVFVPRRLVVTFPTKPKGTKPGGPPNALRSAGCRRRGANTH